MAETAVKEVEVEQSVPFVRRFERPDIDRHGAWLVPRMMQAFPHMLEPRHVHTFILNVLPSNEFLFLYQDHGVALAQVVRYGINPEPVVEELFVWTDDPTDEAKQKDASYFYAHFHEYAKRKQLATIIVEQNTDVPRKLIAEVTGKRVFENKQAYLRLK